MDKTDDAAKLIKSSSDFDDIANATDDVYNGVNKLDDAAGELGQVGKGISISKFQEVFDIADNYNLSDETFNGHILERHGSNSTFVNKSHFNADFDIKAGIDSTLKRDNFIVKPNKSNKSGYIFEQTFKEAIGVNSKGESLYTLKIVIDESGNVITAFPIK